VRHPAQLEHHELLGRPVPHEERRQVDQPVGDGRRRVGGVVVGVDQHERRHAAHGGQRLQPVHPALVVERRARDALERVHPVDDEERRVVREHEPPELLPQLGHAAALERRVEARVVEAPRDGARVEEAERARLGEQRLVALDERGEVEHPPAVLADVAGAQQPVEPRDAGPKEVVAGCARGAGRRLLGHPGVGADRVLAGHPVACGVSLVGSCRCAAALHHPGWLWYAWSAALDSIVGARVVRPEHGVGRAGA
jgi:hypothetical protein